VETVGLSPKAIAAAFMPFVPGLVLLILGLVSGDDTVRNVGIGLLGASPLAGGAAVVASPGKVVPNRDRPAVKKRVIVPKRKDPA
jgi:hypothetical protein